MKKAIFVLCFIVGTIAGCECGKQQRDADGIHHGNDRNGALPGAGTLFDTRKSYELVSI